MRIHDLPKKWRERAHGDAGLLACADELEAHLKDASLCFISEGPEIQLEVILPEAAFEATMTERCSCVLSTEKGDTRRGGLGVRLTP